MLYYKKEHTGYIQLTLNPRSVVTGFSNSATILVKKQRHALVHQDHTSNQNLRG
ncbi:hypothetical protein [Chitinivibrio alkaliphilus]|uniref:Uncharacterized protein n=1 Tax=Chitinivibrio alkaliphilus ACht1 TaxID=1313304 RepID=U7DBA4_9BACT|nr:hypothetical protein [Chitinivibrio alkaliphilus]ERP39287.1 hypothetical protein CALK_0079 [Chitinivibrio alkaliphilus ACht1]